jgi:hypothetical protein
MKNPSEIENTQNLFKNKLEELLLFIKCPCCNNFFVDAFRPYLLKCGHNICSKCINLNKSHYNCLICLQEYNKEELFTNNLPMNFLIDEIIHKLTSNHIIKIENKELADQDVNKNGPIFYCVRCNTLMKYNLLHKKLFENHTIINYEKIITNQNFKLDKMIGKIKENYTENFKEISLDEKTKFMINNIKQEIRAILNKNSNLENDNPSNYLNTMKILELLIENERDKLIKVSSYDDYRIKNENFSKEECENIIDTHFIVENKFPELKTKVNEISQFITNIKHERFTEELAYEVSNYFKNIFYSDIKKNHNTQLCYFRIEEDKILKIKIYDCLMDELFDLEIFLSSISGLENSKENQISVCASSLDEIYITKGKFFYSVKVDENFKITNITQMLDLNIPRQSHISLYYDLNLFIIGGDEHNNKIEYFDFMSEVWINLPDLPVDKNVSVLAHLRAIITDNKLFIFDRLRKCFYLDLQETNNQWKEIKLRYDDSFNLDLYNYCIILDSKNEIKVNENICTNYIFKLVGGNTILSKDENQDIPKLIYNENIFVFDYLSATISLDKSDNIKMFNKLDKMIFQSSTSINKSESVNNKCILLGEDQNKHIKLIYYN